MSVFLEHGQLDRFPLVLGDDVSVDHEVQSEVHNLVETRGHHVKTHSSRGQQRPQLKQ